MLLAGTYPGPKLVIVSEMETCANLWWVFYRRVGWLIGEPHLIKYCGAAHTRVNFLPPSPPMAANKTTQICYSSVSPLQEAAAIGFEQADQLGFWEESKKEMQRKMALFNEIWDELGIPVCSTT